MEVFCGKKEVSTSFCFLNPGFQERQKMLRLYVDPPLFSEIVFDLVTGVDCWWSCNLDGLVGSDIRSHPEMAKDGSLSVMKLKTPLFCL